MINIEMQRNPNPGYDLSRRAKIETGRIFVWQDGRFFQGQNYSEARRVLSLWIMVNPNKIPGSSIRTYETFEAAQEADGAEKVKRLGFFNKDNFEQTTFIRVGRSDRPGCHGIIRYLGILSGEEYSASEKCRFLESEYGIRPEHGMRKVADNHVFTW